LLADVRVPPGVLMPFVGLDGAGGGHVQVRLVA